MQIVYSDEMDKLTPDMKALMEQAAAEALTLEFGEEIEAGGPGDLKASDANAELGVTVVSDDEIRELNRDFRQTDKVTDVLSFPQFERRRDLLLALKDGAYVEDKAAPLLIGDVVICYDQAARQAEEYGTGLTREMLYLFVHSIMHLFGYDHMEEDEKRIMRAKEEAVLSAVGVPRV